MWKLWPSSKPTSSTRERCCTVIEVGCRGAARSVMSGCNEGPWQCSEARRPREKRGQALRRSRYSDVEIEGAFNVAAAFDVRRSTLGARLRRGVAAPVVRAKVPERLAAAAGVHREPAVGSAE